MTYTPMGRIDLPEPARSSGVAGIPSAIPLPPGLVAQFNFLSMESKASDGRLSSVVILNALNPMRSTARHGRINLIARPSVP